MSARTIMGRHERVAVRAASAAPLEPRADSSSAEEQIRAARAAVNGSAGSGPGPNPAQEQIPDQLSLEDLALGGRADGGTRTPDPFITSEVLYQLSYVGAATEG